MTALPAVVPFDDAIAETKGQDRALLLGNGFSVEYFSYANLLSRTGLEVGDPLLSLFEALDTVDFERVVRALDDSALVETAYGDEERASTFREDAQRVRDALVKAINDTHPAHRSELAFRLKSGAAFLGHFANVFTLNYDLLLYWVNLEVMDMSDGFGLGEKTSSGRFLSPFKPGAHCHIFNLHGGLHLFDDGSGMMMKALNDGEGVIATISETIRKGRLPVYVAEGKSVRKLGKINGNDYLRFGLEKLKENPMPLFIFGHSADENDEHIYNSIFRSPCRQLYFGIYQPDEGKIRTLDGILEKYRRTIGSELAFTFFDAETAKVWDAAETAIQQALSVSREGEFSPKLRLARRSAEKAEVAAKC